MSEFLEMIADNIYEIIIGISLLLTTIFNKPKSAEKIKAAKEKHAEKIRQKGAKATKKAQELERQLNELNNEE